MSISNPVLSVVIPVHNGAKWLPTQLKAVTECVTGGLPVELIVVDNRSTDGSGDIARHWGQRGNAQIRVIDAIENQGEPYARNIGVGVARSDKIAFCDADDVVSPGWAAAMIDALEFHDYVTGPVDSATLNDPWVAATREASMITSAPTVHGIPFANGCNMGFRRSLLDQLGGFDESFLIGCDIEIAIRAWRSGAELQWEPGAVVQYRLRSSPRDIYRQARSYGQVRLRLARLVPEVNLPELRRKRLRRAAWLVRHLSDVVDAHRRAKWMWVAGQVVGETESRLRPGIR